MRIDFIADVVCPWCWLGWVRLEQALAERPSIGAQVVWRAYQLAPDLPEEGAAREPTTPSGDRGALLVAELASAGLAADWGAIRRTPNTNAAHRLIRWAYGQGRQSPAVDALFTAHFHEGRDITDPVTLAALADAIGLDGMRVLDALSRDLDKAAVVAEHAAARDEGITSVPTMIVDARLTVMGAQPVDRLVRVLDTALREQAA